MTNTNVIFDQSTSQLNESLDKIMDIPDSKVLNKEEQKNIIANVASFAHTLSKASKSGMISPELKDISRNFEKANYDITRMPKEYAQSLQRTYQDFVEVIKENPGAYKNTATKAYCDTYELFNGTKFKNFVHKLKNSKGVKKLTHSHEDYKNLSSIESLDAYFNDLNINERSEEFHPILAAKGFTAELTSLGTSLNTLGVIIIISVVVISILIICLCIISAMYQQKVVQAIEELCANKTNPSYPKKIKKAAVVKSMEDNIPKATNTFVVKPMIVSSKYIDKITEPKYAKMFDKGIDTLDKAPDTSSNESYNQSLEGVPGGLIVLKGFIGAHPIVIPIAIIIALILVIPLLRGLIYWCSRFKFRIGLLLKEQNDTLNNNTEVLIAKLNDPSTSPAEKDRLERVISRQENMAGTLSKLSKLFYKEELNANSDAASNLREDNQVNFDKIAEETNKQVEEEEIIQPPETTPIVTNENQEPDTSSASIIF